MSADAKEMRLTGPQSDAANPDALVWLRASAGTGKTQVLSARVFRLLLKPGVRPENILCLTFTKAGATEMAERINSRLAAWVRMPANMLAGQLIAIGADHGPATQALARQLFARMLDAPGGGLRIVTIHGFCQSLLAGFPMEAGMMPGFRPLDDREQERLRHSVLTDLVVDADALGDHAVGDAIAALAATLGEKDARAFLAKCAAGGGVLDIVPPTVEGQRSLARHLAGCPVEGSSADWLRARCADDAVDIATLRQLGTMLRAWGKRDAFRQSDLIDRWIAAPGDQRVADLDRLAAIWTTADGLPKLSKGWCPVDPDYPAVANRLLAWSGDLRSTAALLRWTDRFAEAIGVGRRYAAAYAQAKRLRGVIDFDDLISQAARLLDDPLAGDWIRYKLDARIDHVLIDEAQDTNADQWTILRSLTADYFAGISARDDRTRTLFAVGDYKQAIFGFQGTSPRHYEAARLYFDERARAAELVLEDVALNHSFRSTRPILHFVDRVMDIVGAHGLGTEAAIPPHLVTRGDTGSVMMMQPVKAGMDADDEADDDSEEGWEPDVVRQLATKIADQVAAWLRDPDYRLAKGERLGPGDVLILVESRGTLASSIVARLHAAGVPVAGVDRMTLGVPLGVQDCMAAIRFALQPLDDLNLAALLVSPLIGWTQDDLMARAIRPAGTGLWRWLRQEHAEAQGMDVLREYLRIADFVTPHRFLETMLAGPQDGRRRLAERLGSEVFDPLDELVNAALQFGLNEGGTLQDFVDWFDRSDIDVKREAASAGKEVRVMTVHGAKGLQAPLVILADAARDPKRKSGKGMALELDRGRIPLLPIGKHERTARLAEAAEQFEERALQEHKRLMYVALTRAEQRLVIAGYLNSREEKPAEHSWFACLERAMDELGADRRDDPRWGWSREHAGEPPPPAKEAVRRDAIAPPAEPAWLRVAAPAEARPPRPLVPTAGAPDDSPAAAPSPAMRAAAERGTLIHSLFERLPAVAAPDRRAAALRWLANAAPQLDARTHGRIVDQVMRVIDAAEWTDMFGPQSLAEVPIAAVVGGTVVTGRADRLLIAQDRIEVVDFKTGSLVPDDASEVAVPHLRQMAWYVAALETLFPGRTVSAAILYSHAPAMIRLGPDALAAYRPG